MPKLGSCITCGSGDCTAPASENGWPSAIQMRVGMGPSAMGFKDRKSTRLNSSHLGISYAVFCLKKKKARSANELGESDRRSVGRRAREPADPVPKRRCQRSFFFNHREPPDIYSLPLKAALPI